MFFTDQQRFDSSALHGCPLDLPPNFDRMAQRGTHLFNAVTCQPVCGPARSAFQTGLWPTTSGCFRNGIGLPEDAPKIGEIFRDAGWSTGYIGKWHMYEPPQGGAEARAAGDGSVPEDQRCGYDYWLASNLLEFTSEAYQCVPKLFLRCPIPVTLALRVDLQNDAL